MQSFTLKFALQFLIRKGLRADKRKIMIITLNDRKDPILAQFGQRHGKVRPVPCIKILPILGWSKKRPQFACPSIASMF